MSMPGGLSPVHDATPEIQEMVDGVKKLAEEKAGKGFDMFQAVSYRSQVVAGTNYFIKVKVSCNSFIELRIYKSLDQKVELSAIKEGLTEDSDIVSIQ